jgi:hypothetical protein
MDGESSVLRDLGKFKIWTTILLSPLMMLALVAGMLYVHWLQRGWTASSATATAACSPPQPPPSENDKEGGGGGCTVPVDVEGLSGTPLPLRVPSGAAQAGQKWPVVYDPKRPAAETLTTAVLLPGARLALEIGLAIALLFVAALFALNLRWREDRTWQNISGVMQGADLASSVLRGFRGG